MRLKKGDFATACRRSFSGGAGKSGDFESGRLCDFEKMRLCTQVENYNELQRITPKANYHHITTNYKELQQITPQANFN
jgi:hypothetical protein